MAQRIRSHGLARLCTTYPKALTAGRRTTKIMIEADDADHFGLCHVVGFCQVGNGMVGDIAEFFL